MDGAPYYIDTTWDDPDTGSIVYRDYFMVSGDQLRADHVWDEDLFLR